MGVGLIFAILSPILSSIGTIFESGATKALNPFVVASFSSLIGVIFLTPYLLFQRRKISLKEIFDNKNDLLILILSRVVLGRILFTLGLSLTEGVKAIFFTKVEPYFVLLWFWLIKKEPVKPKQAVLLAIHVCGAVLLSTGGKLTGLGGPQLGDLLIVAAVAFSGLSYHPASNLTKRMGAVKTNIISLLGGGLILLPTAVLFSNKSVWHLSIGWAYLAADAFIFTAVALTLWFMSLKTVKEWIVSALRAIGPIFGVPFAYFLFRETLSPMQFFGGAIILITSILIVKEHLNTVK